MSFPVARLPQRAKIGPSKHNEGSSANDPGRFDTNGNRDRMKLSDFNFLMVLGKGSFGKVRRGCALFIVCLCVCVCVCMS